jgi:hypothetical protein
MSNLSYWVKGLGIAISGAIVFSGTSAIAEVKQIEQNSTIPIQVSASTCWSEKEGKMVDCTD